MTQNIGQLHAFLVDSMYRLQQCNDSVSKWCTYADLYTPDISLSLCRCIADCLSLQILLQTTRIATLHNYNKLQPYVYILQVCLILSLPPSSVFQHCPDVGWSLEHVHFRLPYLEVTDLGSHSCEFIQFIMPSTPNR